jgi:hypothetical protein
MQNQQLIYAVKGAIYDIQQRQQLGAGEQVAFETQALKRDLNTVNTST